MANNHRCHCLDNNSVKKFWKAPQHKKKFSKLKPIWIKCYICAMKRGQYNRAAFKRGEDNVHYRWND